MNVDLVERSWIDPDTGITHTVTGVWHANSQYVLIREGDDDVTHLRNAGAVRRALELTGGN